MAVAETPRIARIGDWTVRKALAVGLLRGRRRIGVRMWATIVRHVEALGEASRHAMGRRMGMVALRRGVRRNEGLLRGHDGEVGHAAAGRRWRWWQWERATQGDVIRLLLLYCLRTWAHMGKRGRCINLSDGASRRVTRERADMEMRQEVVASG